MIRDFRQWPGTKEELSLTNMDTTIPQTASGLNLQFISAEENEFLAKETCILITSGVSHDVFDFISGRFGPLEAGLPCKVPLWFALQLRRNGKCIIEIPEWLSVETLKSKVDEQKSAQAFVDIPYFYVEIAQLLLTHAKDDFDSPEETRSLVEDLFNLRMDRLRLQIQLFASTVITTRTLARIVNVGSAELLLVRGFLPQMLWTQLKFNAGEYGASAAASGTSYGVGSGSGASGGGGGSSSNDGGVERDSVGPSRKPLRRLRALDS